MSDLQTIYQILQSKKWVDLTHQINETIPHFPPLPALEKKDIFTLADGFHVQQFSVVTQYGTHIDAPIHFVEGGRWLDDFDLKDFILPLYVIDKSTIVADNPDYELSKQDVLDFEAEYGQIPAGSFVAFRSDWHKRWPSQEAMTNVDERGAQRSPGWGRDALEFLIHERQVKGLGHETLDTDSGLAMFNNGGVLHEEYYLLSQDIFQIEVMTNLDQVPATGSLITIAFPHWEKATGSPVRAIAILP
ncbi:cyclase family protein [Streptococcus rifensis]